MLLEVTFAALGLTAQMGMFQARIAWNDDGWVATRPQVLEVDMIAETQKVVLDPQTPLTVWIKQNANQPNFTSDACLRAIAEGFVTAVLDSGRANEFLAILRNDADPELQTLAFKTIVVYIQRLGANAKLSSDFYETLAELALRDCVGRESRPEAELIEKLHLALEHPNQQLVSTLIEKSICFMELGLLAFVPSPLITELPFWFNPEHDLLISRFLIFASRHLLLADPEAWHLRFWSPAMDWLRYHAMKKNELPLSKEELELQVVLLYPAISESLPSTSFAIEYFAPATQADRRAQLIDEALNFGAHRNQLLARHLARVSSPEEFDFLLSRRESEFFGRGRTFEIFLERKNITPKGVEFIAPWLSRPQHTPISAVYWALHRWGESANVLLPALLSSNDSTFSREKREGLGRHLQGQDIRSLWQTQKWTLAQARIALDSLSAPEAKLDGPSILRVSIDLLQNPHGLFDSDKDREITNSLVFLLAKYADSAEGEQLELLVSTAKKVFDLPPDRTTEEVLMMLLNSLLPIVGEKFPELKTMLDEMK